MKTFTNWLKWLTAQQGRKTTPTATRKQKSIYELMDDIAARNPRYSRALFPRDNSYWLNLPAYGNIYIRRAYERVVNIEGIVEFCHYFLIEHSQSNDEEKKLAIEAVVFPIYRTLTGVNYDTDQFKAYGLTTKSI